VRGLAKRSSARPEIVSPLKERNFAGQNYRSTRTQQIQTYQTRIRRLKLSQTTHPSLDIAARLLPDLPHCPLIVGCSRRIGAPEYEREL
jgi:hypothetical protein